MRARLSDLPPEFQRQAREQLADVPRETKFRNVRIELDGIAFDSKWEARRYQGLEQQRVAGIITAFQHHVPFPLHVVGPGGERLSARVLIGEYIADFVYTICASGARVIEDTKSAVTRKHPLYCWKAKHFEAEYGLKIIEVIRARKRTTREIA